MNNIERLGQLVEEVRENLHVNILPFWMHQMIDEAQGGFYGQIDGEGHLHEDAPKGAILNARILWTFSSAYRLSGEISYLDVATRAKEYILKHFIDTVHGGVYWSLHADGSCLDSKKQIYALAFVIYGLSEYVRATQDAEALDCAISIFKAIEAHSFDHEKNGYGEALTREWGPISDMRLSDKDENENKTMNTHLHILEAYTNLYRVYKDKTVENQLRNLIQLFVSKILNNVTFHLELFFDDDWNSKYLIDSYGHDIESAWLLHEAAVVLDDKTLLSTVESVIPHIVQSACEGYMEDGSMIYEKHCGQENTLNTERHWWVQAETVVGLLDHYQLTGDQTSLDKALSTWEYIKNHLVDEENGEWYWGILPDGQVNKKDDKAGFWKCPYHNGRMCMEIIERFEK